MFEIIDSQKKKVTISLHLEEVYSAFCMQQQIKNQMEVFSLDRITSSCMDNLEKIQIEQLKKEDYEFVIDFFHIKYIETNFKAKFMEWLKRLPNKKVCNCQLVDEKENYIAFGIAKNDYRSAFDYFSKKYIQEKCCELEGYTTQTGVTLKPYINLKKIIEDTNEMIRWCYIIAYDLHKNPFFVKKNKDKKILFFCHTLNGSNIAGVLTQLLGCNLIYVDHLGPYNKLNKINFFKEVYEPIEYIIISDMVCQGNEILRAKNIVEYLGGTVKGCAGILKLDISNISFSHGVEAFAIIYSPKSARTELNYTIKTKLCENECCTKEE